MSQTNEMVKLAITALEDKKGEDIRVIDIHEVSVLADYFLIAAVPTETRFRLWLTTWKRSLAKPDTRASR